MISFLRQQRGTILTFAIIGALGAGIIAWDECQKCRCAAAIKIEPLSAFAQEKISHMAASRESGRQQTEKFRKELLAEYPSGFDALTKADIDRMDKGKALILASMLLKENQELKAKLKRSASSVSFTSGAK